MKQYHKQHYEANRDRLISQVHQYAKDNADKIKEAKRRYRVANKDEISKKAKQGRIEDRKRYAEYSRKYYKANKTSLIENVSQWRRANPDKIRLYTRRNKILRRCALGSHTLEEWQALCDYYMNQCLCCGEVPDKLTRDHIIPISQGGTDNIDNIQPLCHFCNSSKYTKTMDYRG